MDKQKASIKRNNLPIDISEQLDTLVIVNQIALYSKQNKVTDYFKLFVQKPQRK